MKNNQQNNILKILSNHELIPVATFTSVDEVKPVMNKLLEQNIRCIEVTLRTECAINCIEKLREYFGNKICIGVGTIVRPQQIDEVKKFSPDFLVSPGFSKNLIEHLHNSGIAFLPGAVTPAEIIQSMEHGCNILKFFPAHLFGGLSALKTYGGIFPSVTFCPTGGITKENHQDYLRLSNVISVGGSWLMD